MKLTIYYQYITKKVRLMCVLRASLTTSPNLCTVWRMNSDI